MEEQDLHDGGSEDVEVRCHARVSAGRVPGERCLHTCTLLVQDGSRVVYLYAGRGKSGALDDLHQLDLEGNVWTQPKVVGEKPAGATGQQKWAGNRNAPSGCEAPPSLDGRNVVRPPCAHGRNRVWLGARRGLTSHCWHPPRAGGTLRALGRGARLGAVLLWRPLARPGHLQLPGGAGAPPPRRRRRRRRAPAVALRAPAGLSAPSLNGTRAGGAAAAPARAHTPTRDRARERTLGAAPQAPTSIFSDKKRGKREAETEAVEEVVVFHTDGARSRALAPISPSTTRLRARPLLRPSSPRFPARSGGPSSRRPGRARRRGTSTARV